MEILRITESQMKKTYSNKKNGVSISLPFFPFVQEENRSPTKIVIRPLCVDVKRSDDQETYVVLSPKSLYSLNRKLCDSHPQ